MMENCSLLNRVLFDKTSVQLGGQEYSWLERAVVKPGLRKGAESCSILLSPSPPQQYRQPCLGVGKVPTIPGFFPPGKRDGRARVRGRLAGNGRSLLR